MAAPNVNKPTPMADDPNLVLPPAVRAAAARAEALHAQMMSASVEDAGAEPTAQSGDMPSEVPDTTQPEPAPAAPTAPDGVRATEVPVQPVLPTPVAPPEQEESNWEQKFRASQGRLKQANDTVRELTNQVQQKELLLAAMQSVPVPPPEQLAPEFTMNPDDEEMYGEDMLRVISAKAAQIAQTQVSALEQRFAARLAQIEGGLAQVGSTVTQDTREKFKAQLSAELPNWNEINHDQNFHTWLGLTDPYSGGIRLDMLKKAYAEGNVSRTLAFFKGFLQEEAATAPAAAELTPGTIVPKVSLQSLAAPGKAKTVATDSGPEEKPILKRADITKFYSDVSAGKYKGRDDEKRAREQQIFAAANEGRIR